MSIFFATLVFIAQLAIDILFVIAATWAITYIAMGCGEYFTTNVLTRFNTPKVADRVLYSSIALSLIWNIGGIVAWGLTTTFMRTLGLTICFLIAGGIGFLIVENRRVEGSSIE